MPVKTPANSLHRVRELAVRPTDTNYYLNMSPGHAQACVLCICRKRPITKEDLSVLTENDLENLFAGKNLRFDDFTLQGITGRQFSDLSHYVLDIQPPVYVQVWSLFVEQNETVLYIPENTWDLKDPQSQMTLVPVSYQVLINGGDLMIKMDEKEGYTDGDLLYQIEDHLPIPIPKAAIGNYIPLHVDPRKLRVFPDQRVENNYLQKRT